ncbi:hypothetical protein CEXT_19111 [Caerostris extrusa]|uniref:Uncharacterized protein n=1 Tax=Caerostris extrusa TaxID=172846 RepID=A0AAV4P5C6_CAEEX|nr:hypothetical protein CEXT_19111 [Caerostris extrusa]
MIFVSTLSWTVNMVYKANRLQANLLDRKYLWNTLKTLCSLSVTLDTVFFLNPWLILPLLISIPFILLEIFKSTSILHHPFFSIWNTFVVFYEFPLFNTVASFVVAVYCLSLIGRLFAIFHETVCTDKVYWQARDIDCTWCGGATVLRCVLFTVGTNIVVTLLTFLISQVNKLFVMKHSWNISADFAAALASIALLI